MKELYPEVENVWLCSGKPAILVSDRGKEFESIFLEDACDDLSLEQNRPIIISFQDKPPS